MNGIEQTLQNIKLVPENKKMALLLRHSNRFPINSPDEIFKVGLTPEGVERARQFGKRLVKYSCGRLHSAPVGRCLDTANAVSEGAGWGHSAQEKYILSVWQIEEAYDDLLESFPVIGNIPVSVAEVLRFIVEQPGKAGDLDLMITHDTNIACFASFLFNESPHVDNFVDFLEGFAIWQDEGKTFAAWRGSVYDISDKIATAMGK